MILPNRFFSHSIIFFVFITDKYIFYLVKLFLRYDKYTLHFINKQIFIQI